MIPQRAAAQRQHCKSASANGAINNQISCDVVCAILFTFLAQNLEMTQVSLLLCNHVINPNWMEGMFNIRFLPFNIAQDAQTLSAMN